MRSLEAVAREIRVIGGLLRGMPRGGTARQRLERFYAGQADAYDGFRERLLAGRRELVGSIDLQAGEHLIELGAGTGRNLDFFPADRQRDARFTLVDLCPSLLAQARLRSGARPNVAVHEGDAAGFEPEAPADVVMLSYALSMIQDWRAVLANAQRLLRPGGRIAVVDFFVSHAQAADGRALHSALTRAFWPRWFAHDGVALGPERLDALIQTFPDHALVESSHPVPWMMGLRVPHYRFVGRCA